MLLGLLFYGYATGVFSSRKIERATKERTEAEQVEYEAKTTARATKEREAGRRLGAILLK